jgi:hypothetical protein
VIGPPIAFVYGNCVFGRDLGDAWAAFVINPSSYAWLDDASKRSRFHTLVGAIEAVEADLQILRVSAPARGDRCRAGVAGPPALASADAARYLNAQTRRVTELASERPLVYLIASLSEPERDVATFVSSVASRSPRRSLAQLLDALRTGGRRTLSVAELERVRVRADQIHACLEDFLQLRPARGVELQWLVRRAYCRRHGTPDIDGLHEPSALVFERNGEACLAPLEADVLRWSGGLVEERTRHLVIESELGESWQAFLVAGALPARAEFPGPRTELMFAPAESLPFSVDLALNARFLPNELALRIARRRIQDADQILRAESAGDQGVSDQGYERTQDARDLMAYLQAASRPPLLRATLSIAVAARDERELEERVEMCRRAYGEVRLHRPLGDQLPLFLQHLPAQRTRVAGYDDMLTIEQVAAMMPIATHAAGSARGFYLGHTLSGSRQPVLLNLREGSESDRNTTILCVGALGSGKTTLAQKLLYEGFLQGARVIDCDPKGDHRFHLLDNVAPHVQSVALRPDPGLRGMLDPLRVAPASLRQDAAVSFLRDLLPSRAEPSWETALVSSVDRVMCRAGEPTCGEVVRALSDGDATEAQVGRALAVYARSGLTQLGFADPGQALPTVGSAQVTYLPIRDLPSPDPYTARSEYSQAERVGAQIVRLIAMFAMHLMAAERGRLKLFSFDEGWRLLGDPVGRTLLMSLLRMGRSELAVPIISTQLVTDTLLGERESLENLLGPTFVFGMRSDREAARALDLLGLDGADPHGRRFLLELTAGRCLFKDHRGRIEAIQVELVLPELVRRLSTTPSPEPVAEQPAPRVATR